ncbi:hypothetical protein TTHERM_00494500 (macronuclear) [Tetrahymena thermophila SB210]|uniref:Pre-mRNA-splicing factor RBM22 n=1 Tax=Tetrahymena thermophila (strain SB210) TaxID=312017 RepID=I7MHH9_TETTS|nr:hypothetical protein TTHERM_00494500 [Tetrahymena thermophila SB210]EAS02989.2 hypothetical protein TTHERM_00494500 [Tetrahymena thermophila SB210]|eukprot:XP_001023234.2 hypothetical protein TTHERM_00494500 [Tetrahymena thermophila SB210]
MATERGLQIRTAINKQGWEDAEFPILCETCLGDNPYVRMMKEKHGQECKICTRPFTVFRWKAGTKGRFKKTEICQTCAKLKNVCQTCIFDLQYGLPVEVRDKFLAEQAVHMPTQQSNKDYFTHLANNNLDQLSLPYDQTVGNTILEKVARLKPYYERNKARICSFWVKGNCTRGDLCPYSHEKRENQDEDDPLNKQNLKDRFHGKNDPLAQKVMNKIQNHKENDIKPPADPTITSLYIGNITPDFTEQDFHQIFVKYGPIQSIKIISQKSCAFVNFIARKAAEEAIKDLYGNFNVKGIQLSISWSRAGKNQQQQSEFQGYNIQPPQENPPQKSQTEKQINKLGGIVNYSDDEDNEDNEEQGGQN